MLGLKLNHVGKMGPWLLEPVLSSYTFWLTTQGIKIELVLHMIAINILSEDILNIIEINWTIINKIQFIGSHHYFFFRRGVRQFLLIKHLCGMECCLSIPWIYAFIHRNTKINHIFVMCLILHSMLKNIVLITSNIEMKNKGRRAFFTIQYNFLNSSPSSATYMHQ